MSWKNFAPGSSEKKRCDGKNKKCCCGGHNITNAKKSKHHHGTASKLEIRKARLAKMAALFFRDIDEDYLGIPDDHH